MKTFLAFFVFLNFVYEGNSSAQTIISGTVTDTLDNPVAYASVYLSKTTIGTLSDMNGAYTLAIPQQGVYELVTSFVGYRSNSQFISANGQKQTINIKLSLSLVHLNEVTVKLKEENRLNNYTQFLKLFIGETSNSRYCKILNPDDLHLFRNNDNVTLNGFSVKPLKIENRALGYIIHYDLTEFKYNAENGILRFQGDHYFEPLTGTPREVKKWEQHRLSAYYGSRMDLFRAIFSDSLLSENFEIYECKIDSGNNELDVTKAVSVKDLSLKKTDNFLTLYSDSPILISYTDHHPEFATGLTGFIPLKYISTLSFSDVINVYRNGYFDNPYSITWGGEMGKERIADMLPFDFIPYNRDAVESGTETKLTPIENYLLAEKKKHSSDQVFVQTDRNMYLQGDTLYFQAYIRDRYTNQFDSKSAELYVLLFDEKKARMDSSRFRILNSLSPGWLKIPAGAIPGKYHLAAFTGDMQNFDPCDAFQLDLTVRGKDKSARTGSGNTDKGTRDTNDKRDSLIGDDSVPNSKRFRDLRFLPEGGNYLEGQKQRIGFNATDSKGEPVQVKGLLKDSSGVILDTIKSGTWGPGEFETIPRQGMFFELDGLGADKMIWPLPVPSKKGITISVKPVSNRSFSVAINSSEYNRDTVILCVVMNSTTVYSDKLCLDKRQRIIVETDLLPSGIAQIILFNNDLKPVAERLYFINADKHLRYKIITQRESFNPGEETELSVAVTDDEGNLADGVFSIAVVDSLTGHNPSIFTPGIGYMNDYRYGFPLSLPPKVLANGLENLSDEDRDLLLMVYGWSRYNWDIPQDTIPESEEINYDVLKMKILYALRNHRAGRRLDLISLEGPSIKHLITDINGEISLPLDSLPEVTRSVTMMPDVKNKKIVTGAMLSIPYNEMYFKSKKLLTSLPEIPLDVRTGTTQDFKISWADSIIEIPGVTIRGYQRPSREFQNKYEEEYQYADIRSLDPKLLWSSVSLNDAIYKMLFPYMMTDNYIILRQPHSFFGAPPIALIVLDGMPLYYNGWDEVRSYSANQIASVSVLFGNEAWVKYGSAAVGGVIFVNTMSDNAKLYKRRTDWILQHKNDHILIPIDIYRANREFYCPSEYEIEHDLDIKSRSTIYWNPEVSFNGKEPVKIHFNNLKHYGPVIITVNGVSSSNLAGTGRSRYRVIQKTE